MGRHHSEPGHRRAAPGTTATIYYVIGTTDDDDAVAGCQYHATFSPTSGVYSFVIKRAN